MKRTLLAAGATALALGLPATAALADGYNARPVYMQAKPKPAPRAHVKPPAAKPRKQATHKPRVHRPAPKHHGYAAAHIRYEELETVETSVTHEVNGRVDGPYVSYSERYISPERGCYPHAPCGYSTGGAVAAHGHGHDDEDDFGHGHGAHHQGAYASSAYGHAHGAHHQGGYASSAYGHAHGAHHQGVHASGAYGHSYGAHHGVAGGHHGYPGAYHGSSYGHGASTAVHPGFHHGALSGGVGYGVDGGPVYGGTVIVRPGGHGHGFGVRGSRFSSSSAYSSAQAYGSASASYGAHGHGYAGHSGQATSGHQGFGYGSSYGTQGNGYLGFKPGAFGHGVGATGYTGFRR